MILKDGGGFLGILPTEILGMLKQGKIFSYESKNKVFKIEYKRSCYTLKTGGMNTKIFSELKIVYILWDIITDDNIRWEIV